MAKLFSDIAKFNPYHDSRGRFSDHNGSASFSTPRSGSTNLKPKPGTTIRTASGGKQTAIDTEEKIDEKPKERDYRKFSNSNDKAQVELGKERENQWKALNLDKKQLDSIGEYTTIAYADINNHLRKGTQISKENKAHIDNLNSVMDKAKLTEDVQLFRASNTEALEGMFGTSDPKQLKAMVGKSIQDKAFVSTTVNENTLSGNVVFKIKAPSGSKGLIINGNSQFPSENEILLPAGSKFKISSVKVKGKKTAVLEPKYEIELEYE